MQTSFIALYRGQTVAEARLVAVTAEPDIVKRFVRELADEPQGTDKENTREALRLVRGDEE